MEKKSVRDKSNLSVRMATVIRQSRGISNISSYGAAVLESLQNITTLVLQIIRTVIDLIIENHKKN